MKLADLLKCTHKMMWNSALKEVSSKEVRLRTKVPGWWPGRVKGGSESPPWGLEERRKQERKEGRKEERKKRRKGKFEDLKKE